MTEPWLYYEGIQCRRQVAVLQGIGMTTLTEKQSGQRGLDFKAKGANSHLSRGDFLDVVDHHTVLINTLKRIHPLLILTRFWYLF